MKQKETVLKLRDICTTHGKILLGKHMSDKDPPGGSGGAAAAAGGAAAAQKTRRGGKRHKFSKPGGADDDDDGDHGVDGAGEQSDAEFILSLSFSEWGSMCRNCCMSILIV